MSLVERLEKSFLVFFYLLTNCIFCLWASVNAYIYSSVTINFILLCFSTLMYWVENVTSKKFYQSVVLIIVNIIIILIEILIGKSLSFTLRFCVFIILLILQFAIFIVALAKVKEKNYQVEKDVTQHKKRISLYTFFGLFLLFLGGLLTLFFGKTNWIWQLIFLPILLISTYGTIKYAFYILIFKKDFKIKTLRCVINILSLILMISLCIVFSDDAAFNAKEGSVDLILLTFIIIFFALPFKTGYTCNKVIRSKKSDA